MPFSIEDFDYKNFIGDWLLNNTIIISEEEKENEMTIIINAQDEFDIDVIIQLLRDSDAGEPFSVEEYQNQLKEELRLMLKSVGIE